MENKIESRTDKIEVQPKDHRDDEFLGDLNDAILKKIKQKQPTDQDNGKSPKDTVVIANAQQPSDVLLNDQEYEQLYSQAQQQVKDAVSMLTDAKSNLARLLANDLSQALANNETIYLYHNAKQGATINNYNKVIDAISNLKSLLKSK